MSEIKTFVEPKERKESSANNTIDLLGIPDSSSDEKANNLKLEKAEQKDSQKGLARIIPELYDEFLSIEETKTTFKTVLKFYKKKCLRIVIGISKRPQTSYSKLSGKCNRRVLQCNLEFSQLSINRANFNVSAVKPYP